MNQEKKEKSESSSTADSESAQYLPSGTYELPPPRFASRWEIIAESPTILVRDEGHALHVRFEYMGIGC